MPIIQSAKKKLRQDKKRREVNIQTLKKMRSAVKAAHKKASKDTVNTSYSAVDLAAKKGVIHKNKAARIKSQLAHLLVKKTTTTPPAVSK